MLGFAGIWFSYFPQYLMRAIFDGQLAETVWLDMLKFLLPENSFIFCNKLSFK